MASMMSSISFNVKTCSGLQQKHNVRSCRKQLQKQQQGRAARAKTITTAKATPTPRVPEGDSAVTHLECALEGDKYDKGVLHNLSAAMKPLIVKYDYAKAAKTLTRESLATRPNTLWKWREILPVTKTENCVYLGEEATPILEAPRLAEKLGATAAGGGLYVKDEGRLPTGSFKARGLVMAVSMAKELGVKRMAMPTNGNAGAALAAYCTSCGIEAYTFAPEDTPACNIEEMDIQGATVYKANGYIDDCGKIVAGGKEEMGWFDTSTLKEPYRIEGKKTMGLELAEQFGFDELPDVILYPTGGGTGLIGMWKAFEELELLGIRPKGSKKPRMVAVQAEGCAPIVNAYKEGKEFATRVDDAYTRSAMGIRVPQAVGDFLIIRACRESGGYAVTVTDDEIDEAQKEYARTEGVLLCPEGAATYAAYKNGLASGDIQAGETALLFNCATGLKYPLPPSNRNIDITKPVDYAAIAEGK
uniref:Tryptophan synthase beta chain-like PALP domain-containing protein n=1 Tax=Pyramimonas obovata TaxID=1411642 RepID=A0A7S0MS41_9CHLO|mmetsp:Transcript_12142/g.25486  ORF Transcript_12142/g.25486 Transcript_12142/m.25486 type:complete len:474 (+) Transcript_12142:146-1567(+)|eukprot:CAMPEP_0118931780 /NCGR_PEP_ID=MMETSP1169-20130426/8001_1 /TAXON_ID=36882 /ORGANISM="Pyramimonas obovata, Strain CCMP722" /LENGTH=473 /DNA_ID=CAMNT_0006874319 /DNA_START=146 /DNA_END=1567 /DNA_ORIENTATION=-